MKKRTLNQTWVLCLRMWRSIAKAKATNSRLRVSSLKIQWLHDNGFKNLAGDCFFCEYIRGTIGCKNCPGRLVNRSFGCYKDAYHHNKKPTAFYKELLRLNRIRKTKKVSRKWKILYREGCGWFAEVIEAPQDYYLRKDGTIGHGYKYEETPGYWPTKKEAKAALAVYLEKAVF